MQNLTDLHEILCNLDFTGADDSHGSWATYQRPCGNGLILTIRENGEEIHITLANRVEVTEWTANVSHVPANIIEAMLEAAIEDNK